MTILTILFFSGWILSILSSLAVMILAFTEKDKEMFKQSVLFMMISICVGYFIFYPILIGAVISERFNK